MTCILVHMARGYDADDGPRKATLSIRDGRPTRADQSDDTDEDDESLNQQPPAEAEDLLVNDSDSTDTDADHSETDE